MIQKIETAVKSINTIAEFISKISKILGGKETPASASKTEAVTTRQYTTEFLKKDQLLTIIKENIVPGANQSCIMKSATRRIYSFTSPLPKIETFCLQQKMSISALLVRLFLAN